MPEKLYVIEVAHPLRGPILVGPWGTKENRKSWRRFVKAAYHGLPTRVRGFTRKQAEAIQANGGQPPQVIQGGLFAEEQL